MKFNYKKIFLLILFLLVLSTLYPNRRIDSLLNEFSNSQLTDTANSKLMLDIAFEYYNIEDYVKSLEFAEQSILISQQINDSLNLAKVKELKGSIYSEVSEYQRSIQSYLSALYIYENLKEDMLVAKIKQYIGNIYVKIEQYNNAFEYLFSARQFYLSDSTKYKSQLIDIYNSIGIAYGSIDSLQNALYFFEKTIELIEEKDSSMFLGGLYNNIGAIFSKKDENSLALDYYGKSLKIFTNLKSQVGIGVATSNIAYILSKQKKYTESIKLYLEAIDIFKQESQLLYLRNSYDNLSSIFEDIGDISKALSYQKMYVKLNDSLINTEMLSKIADLQMQYEIRKKDDEMKVLEKEKKYIEQKNRVKEIQKYLLVVGLFFVIIFGILIFRNLSISLKNNKLKQQVLNSEISQLNKDLEFKSKEIENLALHLIQRNDILREVKTSLKTIKKSVDESTNIKINDLSLKINQFIKGKEEVKQLQQKLEEINAEFFDKLNEKFPSLTKNELQLCALIKLGLNSKEIALLNNVSERAVITARYRMRKKIDISADQNLHDFIQNLS